MTDEVFAHRVSLVIRWALALVFAYVAYRYQEAWFLYIFSGVLFITGFIQPRRCIDTACSVCAEQKSD